MIARLYVQIPFSFTIPEGEKFTIYEAQYENYRIRYYPPQHTIDTKKNNNDWVIKVNDVKTIEGNIIWLDFIKESFNRSKEIECDPSFEVIKFVINDFLNKIRYVTKGFIIRSIDFPNVSWELTYLDDDGSKLENENDKTNNPSVKVFPFSLTTLNKEMWDNIHNLPSNWYSSEWNNLLLDATSALPAIGQAIVLAASALEVFIGSTLDRLAENNLVPKEIWNWINERDWIKKPSPEEQFDFLLKFFTKKSLKDNSELWKAFKNLKNARNTFVHNGVAMIESTLITLDKTRELIKNANDIINYVKNFLPEEMKWPEYNFNVRITASKTFE